MDELDSGIPTPSASPTAHFFSLGEKCEKPLDLPSPAKRKMTMQEEEFGHHAELECQRSARQSLLGNLLQNTLLNSVLGNLEDF